jgi:branched-chain amino acid transport system permease protein
MEYLIHLITVICISGLLSQSFNLIFGLGGQFHLAHCASYAIGAYVVAILTVEHSFSVEIALLLGGVGGTLFAGALSACAKKLTGDYFALGTLALHSLVIALLTNWKELTRGVLGIPGIPRPLYRGEDLYDPLPFMWYVLMWTGALQILLFVCFRSPFARCLASTRNDVWAAAAVGINSEREISRAFHIGSALAGISGGLFASFLSYIDPSSFQLSEMVFILCIVILGQPGNFFGCLGATSFLVILPEGLRFIELPSYALGPLRQLLYAAILYGVLLVRRERLFPLKRVI